MSCEEVTMKFKVVRFLAAAAIALMGLLGASPQAAAYSCFYETRV